MEAIVRMGFGEINPFLIKSTKNLSVRFRQFFRAFVTGKIDRISVEHLNERREIGWGAAKTAWHSQIKGPHIARLSQAAQPSHKNRAGDKSPCERANNQSD